MRPWILFFAFSLLSFSISGTTLNKRIYINRGNFVTVKNTTFPFLAFNSTPSFDPKNTVLKAQIGDSLKITVVNNDSLVHGFQIKNSTIPSLTLSAGDSATVTITANSAKAYIYFDSYQFPNNSYLGLAGMICFESPALKSYYWNIKDHQTDYNQSLSTGTPVNWNVYYPDYFTINGLSFPDLQNDTTARVDVSLGDTTRIYLVNTGSSTHSIHFHGFHFKAIFASDAVKTGWEKDTWPLNPMDVLVLEFIADKTGLYSVHDHNLVAVQGGGTHPNGMFLIMKVN